MRPIDNDMLPIDNCILKKSYKFACESYTLGRIGKILVESNSIFREMRMIIQP
jgi:hypothetical protein